MRNAASVRSLEGWSAVTDLRRSGEKALTDERILGSKDFVVRVLVEADHTRRHLFSSVLTGRQAQHIIARIVKKKGFKYKNCIGEVVWSDPASSILFSLSTGAGIRSAFGGDSSEVGCFALYNLPFPGRKTNILIKLINPVPHFAGHLAANLLQKGGKTIGGGNQSCRAK